MGTWASTLRGVPAIPVHAVRDAYRVYHPPAGPDRPAGGGRTPASKGLTARSVRITTSRDRLPLDAWVLPGAGPHTVVVSHGMGRTRSSGLGHARMALRYAVRLQRAGRATSVLCGAVEEFSPARAWLDARARDGGPSGVDTGEGCVVLLLEPTEPPSDHGRAALADVRALEFGVFADPGDVRSALADCVRRALRSSGVDPATVRTVAPSQPDGVLRAAEDAAAADVLGPATALTDVSTVLGDTGAASATFQIAAVLAGAEAGSAALITSVDRDGVLGCALLGVR